MLKILTAFITVKNHYNAQQQMHILYEYTVNRKKHQNVFIIFSTKPVQF